MFVPEYSLRYSSGGSPRYDGFVGLMVSRASFSTYELVLNKALGECIVGNKSCEDSVPLDDSPKRDSATAMLPATSSS